MNNTYGICRVAVAPLRATANDRAEIVSQLLFGDPVVVIDKEERWSLVQSAYDGYQGWLDYKQLTILTSQEFTDLNACPALAPLNFDNMLKAADGSIYHISAGSNLPFYADGYCFAGGEKFEVTFEPHFPAAVHFNTDVDAIARFFLNTPYLWGGRNVMGIDCSGFAQMVFKLLNIRIKRDAAQQAEQGTLVAFLAESLPGDLAFFDNDAGKITHVGIMLNSHTIIHAAGKVRIDPIDDQGIYNAELGYYTHKLRIVKRFVQ